MFFAKYFLIIFPYEKVKKEKFKNQIKFISFNQPHYIKTN